MYVPYVADFFNAEQKDEALSEAVWITCHFDYAADYKSSVLSFADICILRISHATWNCIFSLMCPSAALCLTFQNILKMENRILHLRKIFSLGKKKEVVLRQALRKLFCRLLQLQPAMQSHMDGIMD